MGEFEVHRVRFFRYVPAGVRCVAYERRSARLALARTDGAVEVFNVAANCFQEKAIPGHAGRPLEALCWARGRLFGAGLAGELCELDLERLRAARAAHGLGGAAWSLAADGDGQRLAVGCEDGSVRLFQVVPGGVQYERSLERQQGRILCLAWHPSGARIATGSVDHLRVLDVATGRAMQRIMVNCPVLKPRASRECVVWSVAFLASGAVVSADSFGRLQFWDWETGTLLESHATGTSAALSLAVSEEEDSIVVGTSAGATYQFQLLPVKMGSEEKRWVRTKPFQFHTHDVRAVAHSPTALISGGLDGQLVIRPLMERVQKKGYEAALRKFTFPHRRLVSCARFARLLLFQFPQHLELWRLGSTEESGKDGEVLPVSRVPEHLVQLKSKGPEHIYCSCISPCGGWIAYSTASRFHLYRVHYKGDSVSIDKVPDVPKLPLPAYQLQCSEDSSSLFVASERGSVHVLQLLEPGGCKRSHTLRPPAGGPWHLLELGDLAETPEAVYLLAPSADGKWLAAASGDWEIHVYSLKHFKHHCAVPKYSCAVTALAIHPLTNNLVIAYADQQLFEFSIPEKQYTAWSRTVQNDGLHKGWLERDSPITHIAFNPGNPAHILLHDVYMVCLLDKSLPLPDDSASLMNQNTLKQLPVTARKRQLHAFKICKRFQPLLFADLLDENCLVTVERPIMDIRTQLPPPVQKKKFGT